MLEMKPACERCEAPLPLDSESAVICSFECTFCTTCDAAALHGTCPNCSGQLRPRPPRTS